MTDFMQRPARGYFMDNNPDWNSFWNDISDINTALITRIHHLRIFSAYKKVFDKIKIKSPDVIELGCGTGELTARIIQKYGGTATLVDNSDAVLKIAFSNFRKHGIKVRIFKMNLLKSNPGKKYDIVHSEGLIEHFTGKEQKKILEAHRNCISRNGFALISVPRKIWYYSVSRRFLEIIGKWQFGDEKPMNANELKRLLEQNRFSVKEYFNSGRWAFALAAPAR